MNSLINFDFESKSIRAVIIDNNPWFVATDVCDILKLSNTSKALQSLDDDERSNFKLGRQGDVNIINESGLYILILRCRDAIKNGTMAYRFRKWVTNEVLPSIRKTGSYSVTINSEQQYLIQKAVNEKSFETGIHYGTIYTMIHDEFRIPRYEELLAIDFDKAITFIRSVGRVIESKSRIANAPENLPNSRAFALALMANGSRKHDEVKQAYSLMRDKLLKVIDGVREVERMINYISQNDGAIHDGFVEAKLYLFMDDDIRKASVPIAQKLYKPLDFTNI